jgi:hypothetical protein
VAVGRDQWWTVLNMVMNDIQWKNFSFELRPAWLL